MVKYKRLKVPVEFDLWMTRRKANIESILRDMKIKVPKRAISKMNVMRAISKTDGIFIHDTIFKEVFSKREK